MDYLDPDDFEGLRAPSEQWNASIPPQPPITERYLTTTLEEIPVADLIDLYEGIKSALPAHKLQDIDQGERQDLGSQRGSHHACPFDPLADGTPYSRAI